MLFGFTQISPYFRRARAPEPSPALLFVPPKNRDDDAFGTLLLLLLWSLWAVFCESIPVCSCRLRRTRLTLPEEGGDPDPELASLPALFVERPFANRGPRPARAPSPLLLLPVPLLWGPTPLLPAVLAPCRCWGLSTWQRSRCIVVFGGG